MLNRRNRPSGLEDRASSKNSVNIAQSIVSMPGHGSEMLTPRALPPKEIIEKAGSVELSLEDQAGTEPSVKAPFHETWVVIPDVKPVPATNNFYPVTSDTPPADNKHQASLTQEPSKCLRKNKSVRWKTDLSANRLRLESRSKQRNESIIDDSNSSRQDRKTMTQVELKMVEGRLAGVRMRMRMRTNRQAIKRDVLIYEDAGADPLSTTTAASTPSPAISQFINAIKLPEIAELLLPTMAQLNHPASYACHYCQAEGNPMDCMEKHEELQESRTRQHEFLNPYTGIRSDIVNIPGAWQHAQLSIDGYVFPIMLFPTVIDELEAFFVHIVEPPTAVRQTLSQLSPLATVFEPLTARPAPGNHAITEMNPSSINTTWESPAAKARGQYQHFEKQLRHLGAQKAPGLPQNASEYIRVKQGSLSERISFIERQKSATSTMKDLRQAFGGRNLGASDGRSTVLCQASLEYTQGPARDNNRWPKYLSYKSVGDEAACAGQSRTFPEPNTSHEFDMVWANPVSESEEKITDEEGAEAIGSELMKEISKVE